MMKAEGKVENFMDFIDAALKWISAILVAIVLGLGRWVWKTEKRQSESEARQADFEQRVMDIDRTISDSVGRELRSAIKESHDGTCREVQQVAAAVSSLSDSMIRVKKEQEHAGENIGRLWEKHDETIRAMGESTAQLCRVSARLDTVIELHMKNGGDK